MNRATLQTLVHHIFGAAPLDNATLTSDEWNVQGLSAISVVCGIGVTATATSTPTVFTVHASNTATFSPGAGNKIAEATVFPDAARELTIIEIEDIDLKGKYVEVIVTVGNGADVSDIVCYGIGIPRHNATASAADRGAVGVALST